MHLTLRYPGFWLAAGLAAAVLAVQGVLGGIVAAVEMAASGSHSVQIASDPLVLGIINIFAVGTPIVVGILINRLPLRRPFPMGSIPVRAWLAMPFIMAGVGILLSEADNLFRWIFPVPDFFAKMMGDVFLAHDRFLSLSFTLVLVAPVTEELLCRGIMLRGLLGRYRPGMAIALSSMLFAFMHLNPWQTISAFALGLLFGWFYLRTGSLWPCIAGHAINNGICVILVSAPFGWWPAPSASDLQIVEFQPLWMDAAGAVLLLAGLRWFGKATPGIRLDGVPVPPILQPQDLPPVIKT